MSEIRFNKCKICGAIFYACKKDTYCTKCIPKNMPLKDRLSITNNSLNNLELIEEKRKRERERWKARMSNPVFREHERLRSLARARVEKRYAK